MWNADKKLARTDVRGYAGGAGGVGAAQQRAGRSLKRSVSSITMLSGIQENVIELSPATVAEADPP